jgi:hypothetical protein
MVSGIAITYGDVNTAYIVFTAYIGGGGGGDVMKIIVVCSIICKKVHIELRKLLLKIVEIR